MATVGVKGLTHVSHQLSVDRQVAIQPCVQRQLAPISLRLVTDRTDRRTSS